MNAISNENAKREAWAFENSLRRHNHVGLVHALILALAKSGQLDSAKQGAEVKLQERIAKRKAGGKDTEED